MDVQKILQALYEERARIEHTILALETLADGSRKRRGRPTKWVVEARRRLGDGGTRGSEEWFGRVLGASCGRIEWGDGLPVARRLVSAD